MPSVSIVVPLHNRADLLPETLASVLAQTSPDWECIIVDDHSTDGSLDMAQEYARRDARFRATSLPDGKRGPSAARNHGMNLARGAFVTFLDSDDLIMPTKIEKQSGYLATHPDVDFVNCRMAFFFHDAEDCQHLLYPDESYILEYLLLGEEKNAFWQSGCPMWRAESLQKIGGWDEDLFGPEDLELMLRAVISGLHIGHVHEELYKLRRGTTGRISGQPRIRMENYRRQLHLKLWRTIESSGLANDLRRKLCADNFYRRATVLIKNGATLSALQDFICDNRAIGTPPTRTAQGALLLLLRKWTFLEPFASRLGLKYFAYKQALAPMIS